MEENKPNEYQLPATTPKMEIQQKSTSALSFVDKCMDENTIIGSVCKNVIFPRLVETAYEGALAGLKKLFWGEDTKYTRGGSSSRGGITIGGNHTQYNTTTSSNSYTSVDGSGGGILKNSADKYRGRSNVYKLRISNELGDAWEQSVRIEDVLSDKLQASGLISVADLYDAAHAGSPPSTANNWGWDSLAKVRRYWDIDDPNIVVFELPKPKDIRML